MKNKLIYDSDVIGMTVIMVSVILKEHLRAIDNDLASLILTISKTAVGIKERLPYMRDIAETQNIYGELQSALDLWTDQLFIEEFRKLGLVNKVASEEQKNLARLDDNGRFFVTSDPLDGSSNLPSNNLVATIVGVYEKDFYTEGKNQVAALYVLYGPVLSLVYTVGEGVHEFLYKPSKKEFILENENKRLPEKGKLCGFGGSRKAWLPPFRKFAEELEEEGLKVRYSGAFAADINQILHYGGIFAYPALKEKLYGKGKLRLLFEANPISFMMEQAGGASSNGKRSILEVKPTSLDQRIPTYVGNENLIKRLERALKG